MKVLILSLILAMFLVTGVSAIDWGGTVDNRTTPTFFLGPKTANIVQEDKLALWVDANLGTNLNLLVQGSYTYSNERLLFINLDLAKIEGQFLVGKQRSSLFRFTAGRFPLAEFTGRVLNASVDGFRGGWSSSLLNATAAVAFTGLQIGPQIENPSGPLELAPESPVSMTWADEQSASVWAPPRLIELVELHFPELLSRQDLRIVLVAQQDLRGQDTLNQEGDSVTTLGSGGLLHSVYLGLGIEGPLPAGLYYDLFSYVETGKTMSPIGGIGGFYEYSWMLSVLAGGGLRYYIEDRLASRAELRFIFASGDSDYTFQFTEGNTEGLATTFVPISLSDIALEYSPRIGNLSVIELGYSLKPVDILQTGITGYVFLRPTSGTISDTRASGNSLYLGSEIDATARLRLLSDLGAALSLGLYILEMIGDYT
jgi:hypothetical protein